MMGGHMVPWYCTLMLTSEEFKKALHHAGRGSSVAFLGSIALLNFLSNKKKFFSGNISSSMLKPSQNAMAIASFVGKKYFERN
jgi:hypothetical protein